MLGVVATGAHAGCEPEYETLNAGNGRGGNAGRGNSDAGRGGTAASGGTGGITGGGNNGGDAGMGTTLGGGGSGDGGAPDGGVGGLGGSGGMAGLGGEGGGSCESGVVTCPGAGECGTELDVGNRSNNTVTNCGKCGLTCSLDNAKSSTCADGTCSPACLPGFEDCNAGSANDGCEADLSSPENCGGCGVVCSSAGTESLACTDGLCAPTCAPRLGDCNEPEANDGCEEFLDALDDCRTSCTNGVACDADEVCNNGSCGPPQGLVALTIPFTAAGQVQRFADRFPAVPNLTGSALTLRVYAPGATAGTITVFAVDATDASWQPEVTFGLASLSEGWTDLEIPLFAANAFDPNQVFQVTFDITSAGTGPWTEPWVVYIDGVWSSNLLVNDTFDADAGQIVKSSLVTLEGSDFRWVQSLPD